MDSWALELVHRRAAALSRAGEAWQEFTGIEVKVSDQVDIPVVCGLARPAVLLPVEARQWPGDRSDRDPW